MKSKLVISIVVLSIILTGSLFAQRDQIVNEFNESSRFLREGTLIERQNAIFRLSEQNQVQAVDLLLEALKDPDPAIRYSAAWALSQSDIASQYPLIIEGMLESVKDQNLWVRTQVIDTLRQITFKQRVEKLDPDERVLKTFMDHAKDPDPYIRANATQGLVLWGKNSSAKKALLASFKDDVWLVRRHALGRFGPKGYYGEIERQLLIEALRDDDYTIRIDALYNLRNYGDEPQLIDHLIERLYDPNGQVILETIISLGFFKDERAVEPLLELLAKNKAWGPGVRSAVDKITGKALEEVLKDYRPEPSKSSRKVATVKKVDVQEQIDQFKNGDQSERISAILRLTWSDQPEAVETLIKALEDDDPRVRYAAADAIGANYLTQSRRTDRVLAGLFNAAVDSDRFVRMKAIETLSKFTIEEHRARVLNFFNEALSKEEDPFIRREIQTAIENRSRTD